MSGWMSTYTYYVNNMADIEVVLNSWQYFDEIRCLLLISSMESLLEQKSS